MGSALSALILLVTKYGFLLDIAKWVWTSVQTYRGTKAAEKKDTDVAHQIDASVDGASDAAIDERLRHFQRD